MNLIAAVDENWAIGNKGELLITIPADHKLFRQETMGKVVVYGRKTLATFPQGLALKGRTNIVLSSNPSFTVKDAVVVHSPEELLEELKKYDTKDVYIIGGESVYKALLPYCGRVYVTKISRSFPADTWVPNLDEDPSWRVGREEPPLEDGGLSFRYVTYERVK